MVKRKDKKIKKKVQKFFRNFDLGARKITFYSIIVAIILVTVSVAMGLFFAPENQIKRRVEAITADYYENYFYKTFSETVTGGNVTSAVAGYEEKGFAIMPLRQLLLFDGGKYSYLMDEMKKYCDTDATTIQIFPKEPYGNKDYHVEYKYSCNF